MMGETRKGEREKAEEMERARQHISGNTLRDSAGGKWNNGFVRVISNGGTGQN